MSDSDEVPLIQRLSEAVDEFILYRLIPLVLFMVFAAFALGLPVRAAQTGRVGFAYLTFAAYFGAFVAGYMVWRGKRVNGL